MKKLALAAIKVSEFRPHPKAWWDDDMKPESLAEYEAAMKEVRELKSKLGL